MSIRRRNDKNKRLKAEERKMFLMLWNKYPHRCEVTGWKIPSFSPANFHHILSKQAYPGFYLEPRNILICLPEIHRDVEDHPWKKEYEFVKLMAENLKRLYHNDNTTGF